MGEVTWRLASAVGVVCRKGVSCDTCFVLSVFCECVAGRGLSTDRLVHFRCHELFKVDSRVVVNFCGFVLRAVGFDHDVVCFCAVCGVAFNGMFSVYTMVRIFRLGFVSGVVGVAFVVCRCVLGLESVTFVAFARITMTLFLV